MRIKAMVMVVMVTVLVVAGACSPVLGASPPKEANIEVTMDEFVDAKNITREIEVADGGTITVVLGSNPTTGFSWTETAGITDPSILEQTENKMITSEDKDVVGSPGNQVWTFKALQKGTTTVIMDYSRPWEGGEKAEWTFELTVTVN